MKKQLFLILAAFAGMAFAACEHDDSKDFYATKPFDSYGASKSSFSVSATHQVHFSKGNLQYCTVGAHSTASGTTGRGTFRFAIHQYDYLGEANALVSDTNTGWIDLLCWGSSGWHVDPWSEKDGDYEIESLCGSEAFADWGVYNAIQSGGAEPEMWRTLTRDEWHYLVNLRAASTVDGVDSARFAEATVAGVAGLILFPDQFTRPETIDPIAGINGSNLQTSFTDNVYTAEQWPLMEKAGAIFLPAAGFRGGTMISTLGEGGSYWASTCNANRQAYALTFISGLVNPSAECTYEKDRGYGRSVRLVRDVK